MPDIQEAEDVARTGNKIAITLVAEAVMYAIAAGEDANGPSAVTVMLLDKDCEEGEVDDATDEVMWELRRDAKAKDNDGGKVEVKDCNGGVIKDDEDGGGAR